MSCKVNCGNALITGGSAGLGAAVSRQLGEEGVNLAINYNHSEEKAEALVEELIPQFIIRLVIIKADAADKS